MDDWWALFAPDVLVVKHLVAAALPELQRSDAALIAHRRTKLERLGRPEEVARRHVCVLSGSQFRGRRERAG